VIGNQLAPGIVKLPGQLHQPGPVVEVGEWSSLVVRDPGGLRVKDQVHSSGSSKIGKSTSNKTGNISINGNFIHKEDGYYF
jgi:hypothetical protein